MTHPPFGSLQSPADYRDAYVANAVAEQVEQVAPVQQLPEQFYTDAGQVLHQQQTPSCVAHSVVLLMKIYWFYKTGVWVPLSPRFLDTLAKRFDGQAIDQGTYPRLVMSLAAKYGCATELTCPNDTSLPIAQYRNDKVVLTPEAFSEALKWRMEGYVAIKKTPGAFRQAIWFYGAISALYRVGEEMWVPSWLPKDTDPLRTPATVVSGHQMNPIGWSDSNRNILRNSWGTLWAHSGETHYDQFKWDQFIVEAWAFTSIPKELKEYLKNLPKPEDFHYRFDKDLKRGDISDDVKFLQIAYMILGYMPPVGAADLGIFGPKTSEANGRFQKAMGISPLSPDNAGPKTRMFLKGKFAV